MNPPYEYGLGGKITDLCLENCDYLSCLMPLSNYRTGLYKNVNKFEIADNRLFDAIISYNLCICGLMSDEVNKYEWLDLQRMSFEPKYKVFYDWNVEHDKGYRFIRKDGKPYAELDVDTDFVEIARCCANLGGSGFGTIGCGYQYNVIKDGYQDKWLKNVMYIHFNSKKEKTNFATFWYNGRKRKSLCSRVIIGLHVDMLNSSLSMAIPQIDWEDVENNEYWKNGDYDKAVLDTMGLDLNM